MLASPASPLACLSAVMASGGCSKVDPRFINPCLSYGGVSGFSGDSSPLEQPHIDKQGSTRVFNGPVAIGSVATRLVPKLNWCWAPKIVVLLILLDPRFMCTSLGMRFLICAWQTGRHEPLGHPMETKRKPAFGGAPFNTKPGHHLDPLEACQGSCLHLRPAPLKTVDLFLCGLEGTWYFQEMILPNQKEAPLFRHTHKPP